MGATEFEMLRAISGLALEAGLRAIAHEAGAVAERLDAGRFYVVCVGAFKRGKSTLLNALVGVPVLPTGVVPVTSTVTILPYGARLRARVRFTDRDWEAGDPAAVRLYVSEEHNPANEKGVAAVEVFVPSDLLKAGMCLVDTPGLGSVVVANTAATRAFIPHVDAALLVLGADPPITGEEVALVRAMAETVRDIIVVFNKTDRQPHVERTEAIRFTAEVLGHALGRPAGSVLQVSATERLAGTGSPRDWPRLVDRLAQLARESRADLVDSARERETRTIGDRLRGELDEQRAALLRPLVDSERRVALIRAAAADAERALTDLGHLLSAEQARLAQRFADERDGFFERTLPAAQAELRDHMAAQRTAGRLVRSVALEQARTVARRWAEHWREEQGPRAETLYRQAEQRFIDLASSFRARLAAVPELATLPATASPHVGFRIKSGFHYTEMLRVAPTSAATWLMDHVLAWRRDRAVERDGMAYLRRLLEVNSARIKNDFEERVTESRRLLERDIRDQLGRLITSADTALNLARQARTAGAAAVRGRLESIDRIRSQLDTLWTGTSGGR
jgi:GTPase SAR1 family protein